MTILCVCICVSVCVCVCVCACVCVGSSLVQLLGSWATNPRVVGSIPGLGLAIVTLSKSL